MEGIATKPTFQKYPAYKDSGVKWLGEIPEHWDLLSNKNIFNLKKNQVGKKSAAYTLLSLTLKGIINRVLEDGGKFPAEFDTYQEVKKGDFVFCLFDVEETPRCVGLSDFEGMITGAYTVMEVKSNFDRKFLYYFYLNLDADKRMRPLYTGLRNTISKDNFFAFKTFVPPLREQTAIAAFLYDKTAKIDLAIAQKEKMIALLKEHKQIIIQDLVTGKKVWNVTQNAWTEPAEVKHSGVEWIGEIPEGWECIKFKFIIRTKARLGWKGLKADEYVDSSDYKFLSTPNIKNDDIDFENAYHITEFRYNESPEIMLEVGDVLLVKDGSTLGISNLIKNLPSKCTVNSSIAVLRIKDKNFLSPSFLNYFIKSFTVQKIIDLMKDGMGVPHLFQSDINNFSASIPPFNEQLKIVSHIETQSNRIDKAIGLQMQQIEKLKELKATLIDGAVTGKIKVS